MPAELRPEDISDHLKKGQLSPFYLFYGESGFLLEKMLSRIRDTYIPEAAKDFNLHVFYGDEIKSQIGELIDTARSFPFMSQNRLIIVRRTEEIPASGLESIVPYLEAPMPSTCLIFVSLNSDFRKKFYKFIKDSGKCVNFRKLFDNKVVPWIMKTAGQMGLHLDPQAAVYLHQVIGNQLMDIVSELEKIYIRYGKEPVGQKDVEKLASNSRSFTNFELMDRISSKKAGDAIAAWRRYVAEEGKDAVQGIVGMLIRQMRLLWRSKDFLQKGGKSSDLAKALKEHPYTIKNLLPHVRSWDEENLEQAFEVLYDADDLLKSGADAQLILENVILTLCR